MAGADGRICRYGAARVLISSPDRLAVSIGLGDYTTIFGMGGLLGVCYAIWGGSSPAIGTPPKFEKIEFSTGCLLNMDGSDCG